MRLTRNVPRGSIAILAIGDVVAVLVFVLVGLENHRMTSNLLFNVVRIAAPFLIGWFVVAPFTGAFSRPLLHRPGAFMLRSVLTWLVGIGIGLVLRNTIFGEDFSRVFAIVTLVFTGIFILSWRGLFALVSRRRSRSSAGSHPYALDQR